MWTSAKMRLRLLASHFPSGGSATSRRWSPRTSTTRSVIIYSIGNEIPETGTRRVRPGAGALAEKVRALDGTRYVTNAINGLLAVLDDEARRRCAPQADGERRRHQHPDGRRRRHHERRSAPPTWSRDEDRRVLRRARRRRHQLRRGPLRPGPRSCSPTGSSSAPRRSPPTSTATGGWSSENPHVIGDFTWTGWDYLGEAGIGRAAVRSRTARRPPSAARTRGSPPGAATSTSPDTAARPPTTARSSSACAHEPYIAVQRPGAPRPDLHRDPWAWSDSIASWTWPGSRGRARHGRGLQRRRRGRTRPRRAGSRHGARGSPHPVPGRVRRRRTSRGELTATAIRDGRRAETFTLTSAGEPDHLHLIEEPGSHGDLAFVTVAVVDAAGRINTNADQGISVHVKGDAVLSAVGSGDPAPAQTYDGPAQRTFDGIAMAVVRRTGTGPVTVTVSGASEVADVTIALGAAEQSEHTSASIQEVVRA